MIAPAVPSPLPIDAALPELIAALDRSGAVVLHAPPGAGKTTRVPPAVAAWLDRREAPARQVVVLEPRRVAARAAARRIAAEQGWSVGREVGWWIRFERKFRPDSRIVFATEGVLLRWLQRDPFLDGVGALVFDEFHERSLAADLALAFARRVRREARPELALVVTSATLEVEPIRAYLLDKDAGAEIVRSEGRLFPVDTRLLDRPDDRPTAEQVASAVRRAAAETDGDLLAFLPGMAEIRRTEEALASWAAERGVLVLPLHGDLPAEAQDAALRRGERRRVVLATNVAETSVTVEGVRAVVDSGLARQLRFDPATGLDRLDTVRISAAAAAQRAGRAGREGPGLCLRLWTAADQLAQRPFEPPEVRRVDLASAVLELAAWGERDARAFDWFEAPEPERLAHAVAMLRDLGALDDAGITPLGRRLASLPLAPRLGRLVLEGERLDVLEEAALVAALLSERSPLPRSDRTGERGKTSGPSDLLARLEAIDRRRSRSLFDAQRQIVELVRRSSDGDPASGSGAPIADELRWRPTDERLLRAIAAAWLDRLCRRREPGSDRARMVGGGGVRLARTSAVVDAELFVAVELDAAGARHADALVRAASAVERDWLPAELTRTRRELAWDEEKRRTFARQVTRFDDLELEAKEIPIDDRFAASALLAEHAALDLPRALGLARDEVAALVARWRFLAHHRPELTLPALDDLLLRSLLPTLTDGLRSFDELAKSEVPGALLAVLDWKQRAALDADAPERFEVPSGSRIRLDYSDPAQPVLAVRIQELFGLAATPRIAAGRVPLLLHLLAPSGRPQQVTADLASFWKNTWPIVKRELAARYPKHSWPADPIAARPERGAKKRALGAAKS